MIQYLDYNRVASAMERYYNTLSKTGYVSPGDTEKLVVYFFVLSFIEQSYPYLTDKDYRDISQFLSCLFKSGSCWMTEDLLRLGKMTVGKPYFFGNKNRFRISEDLDLRDTELDDLRRV